MAKLTKRLLRNGSDAIQKLLKAEGEPFDTKAGAPNATYLATFINPVDHRLYDVVSFGRREVNICAPLPSEKYNDPDTEVIYFGTGGIDEDDEKELQYQDTDKSWEDGTFYRSHTPRGVQKKGSGQGLMLYSGLAVYAKFREAAGVFSTSASRSPSATAWWEQQAERGFADSGTAHAYTTTSATIDTEQAISVDDLDPDEEADEWSITEIDPSYCEVYVTLEGETPVQYLPAATIALSGMVVAWNTEDGDVNSLFEGTVGAAPPAVLVEVDLSTTGDPELVKSLWEELKADDYTEEEDLRNFLDKVPRHVLESDKTYWLEALGQKKLPFPEQELVANRPQHSETWEAFFGEAVRSN